MDENIEIGASVAPAPDKNTREKTMTMTRREFMEKVGTGILGGFFSGSVGTLEKLFVPAIHRNLKAAIATGRELISYQKLTIEERAEKIRKGIKDAYGINVEFSNEAKAVEKIYWMSMLGEALASYPPQLFLNLVPMTEQKALTGLDYDIAVPDEQIPIISFPSDNLVEKGYTVKFCNLPGKIAGQAWEDKMEINRRGPVQMNFSKLFAHEFGHSIHDLFGYPTFSSFSPELSPWLTLDSSMAELVKNLPKRMFLPGFVSTYARYNTNEDAAETFGLLLSKPHKALGILEDREYQGELKLKLIAAMDMLYSLSGGLMDKQYYYDLAQGKVNQEYWTIKQAEPYVYGRIDASTVVFVTDIDKSPKERLPTLIKLTEIPIDSSSLKPFSEFDLGHLEGRSITIKKESGTEYGQVINLVVDNIPLNFLYLTEGRRSKVTLQTFSEQISFEIENKNGYLLIGKVEWEKIGNVSEQILKLINIVDKAGKTLGFVVLGAQALDSADKAMFSRLPPIKRKKWTLETIRFDEMNRRDFLRRVAAGVTFAGIAHLLSF